MKHCYSFLLLPCLLLVCCDKQGASENQKGDAVSTARMAHSPDAPTRQPSRSTTTRTEIDAAAAIESPEEREKALALIAWNAMEINPEEASKAFMQLTVGSVEKIRLIKHYAMRLTERDLEEALRWAASIGNEQEIAAANGQIALVLAETDPHRAANFLSESGIAGRDLDVAVVQVVQRWAAKSPREAAAWVETFPPGEARKSGIVHVVSQWTTADAPAAFAWLSTIQKEDVRKEAFLAMEETILQQPATTRTAWLQHADAQLQAELEQLREQAMREIGDNVIDE